VRTFGNFPTLHLGLVTKEGNWEHYDGHLRFVDDKGAIVADKLDAKDYQKYIGEAVQPSSFLKSPYYRPIGYPAGVYRVGPLARLNVCEKMGVPLADKELAEYRQRAGRTVNASFYFHYARLIEIQAAIETIDQMLDDPDMRSDHLLRATAGVNALEGVGVSEAPRGTLFHHYQVDENGLIEKVNLVIATGQNNLAMNRAVAQIAKHYIRGRDIPEGTLNRLEAGIRAFDPCLSCSTHAFGMMPLHLELVASDGSVVNEVRRD
jgi:NAD-reducing hydrogenase large subunit